MSVEELALALPRLDKLRLMEALWVDLSASTVEMDSPSWHEDVLLVTEQRLADGSEKVLSWEEAKIELSRGK